MRKHIKFLKTKSIRKSISMPEMVWVLGSDRARQFPDFSKYVQDLIRRDCNGQLLHHRNQCSKEVTQNEK